MFNKAKAIINMLKFSNNVYNTSIIFKFHDALLALASPEDRNEHSLRLLADKRAASLYADRNRDRYLYQPFDLKKLRQCELGTLGRLYAEMMDQAGLDPEFFDYMEVSDAVSFFILRSRKTHDLHHIVTGFDTERAGEVGVQGYYLGQMGSAFPLSIVASAFISLMQQKSPQIEKTMSQFVDGYHIGKHSAPFHGVIWEDLWDAPIHDVRAMLGITPHSLLTAA